MLFYSLFKWTKIFLVLVNYNNSVGVVFYSVVSLTHTRWCLIIYYLYKLKTNGTLALAASAWLRLQGFFFVHLHNTGPEATMHVSCGHPWCFPAGWAEERCRDRSRHLPGGVWAAGTGFTSAFFIQKRESRTHLTLLLYLKAVYTFRIPGSDVLEWNVSS